MNLTPEERFVGLVRTRSFNIIGFIEMIEERRLALTPGRRAEYAEIVVSELEALDRDVRLYFKLPPRKLNG